MKIAVFGASGKTGRRVVAQALDRDLEVVAFLRTPSKLQLTHANLEVVQGDIQDPEAVESAVQGVDAVISTLGPSANKPDYQVERGMKNIIAAMKKQGVRRLIITSGAGVRDPNDRPGAIDRVIKLLLLLLSRHIYEDMRRTVEVVRGSGLDWTIVRFPMLTDDPLKGAVTAGYVGRGSGIRVGREDAARFLLDQLDSDEFVHAAPIISG